jgi:Fcf1
MKIYAEIWFRNMHHCRNFVHIYFTLLLTTSIILVYSAKFPNILVFTLSMCEIMDANCKCKKYLVCKFCKNDGSYMQKICCYLKLVITFFVKQHKCYIVATCDRDLKRRIRKVHLKLSLVYFVTLVFTVGSFFLHEIFIVSI